jgi:hypothetical protein
MTKSADDLPPDSAGPSAARRRAARVPRNLIEPQEDTAGATAMQAAEIPFSLGMGTIRPGTSIGFEIQQGELIFPWMALQMVQRSGDQMLIKIGEWRFSLEYDPAKASGSGWKFTELIDSLMDQNVRWIRHRPDAGLTVHGVQEEPDQSQG